MKKYAVALVAALVAWTSVTQAALLKTVAAGAVDQSVVIRIVDSTDGTPETGVVFNTSGIDIEYWIHGANSVTDITEATQTTNGAHTDGGFVHLGNGYYRLDLPDAAVATAGAVEIMGTVTGMVVIGGTVDISPPANIVSAAGTAWASGAITAASIATDAIGAAEIAADAIGAAEVANATIDAATFASAAIDATAIATDAIGAAEIATDAIGAAELATDAIGAAELAASAIGASEIADGGITSAEFGTGAITATVIAADAIGASEVAADVSTELLTGLANLAVNVAQVSGDATAADTFETWLDGTTGPVAPLGIARQGTAQSATSTTVVLDASAPFADDTAIGMTLVVCGSTQGYCQSRAITDYVTSTDTATVDTWTVTPSGTLTYYLFSTAPGGSGSGLDAAGVRAAIGLASANLDTQLSTIDDYVDTEVAAILDDTGTSGVQIPAGEIVAATFGAGAIDAAAIAADAIGASEIAANAIGASEVADDAIDAGALAVGAIAEDAFATTAGSFDALAIVDQGTAQSATGTTLVLRSAAAFADDELNGAEIVITGGTGVGQTRKITDYVSATDTATVGAWNTTPSGTITYIVRGASPSSGTTDVNVLSIEGVDATDQLDAHAAAGLDAAGVRTAIGLASANLDTQLSAIDDYVDTEVATAVSQTAAAAIRSAVGLATANLDTQLTAIDDYVDTEVAAILDDTGTSGVAVAAASVRTAVGMSSANLDTQLTAIDDAVDTEVASILQATVVASLQACDSGSTTTCVDAARTESASDYWKGAALLVVSGSTAGEARCVVGFNASTDTLTVKPAFTAALSTNSYLLVRDTNCAGVAP